MLVREDPRDVARDHFGLPHLPADRDFVVRADGTLDVPPWMVDRPLPPGPVIDVVLLCRKPQRRPSVRVRYRAAVAAYVARFTSPHSSRDRTGAAAA